MVLLLTVIFSEFDSTLTERPFTAILWICAGLDAECGFKIILKYGFDKVTKGKAHLSTFVGAASSKLLGSALQALAIFFTSSV